MLRFIAKLSFTSTFKPLLIISFAIPFIFSIADTSLAISKKAPQKSETKKALIRYGKIVETMNSGGYTYINVTDKNGKNQWVAIPETKVTKGKDIAYHDGMLMQNFSSKTLKRTFATIIFSSGLVNKKDTSHNSFQTALHKEKESFATAVETERNNGTSTKKIDQGSFSAQNSSGSMGAIVPFAGMSIEKASGENSYSVGEVFTHAKQLDGKKIKIRGKVMKFSPMIMNRNWIHIQDGTGDPMQNHHDLVITSAEQTEEGAIVIIEGTVTYDKDFGAGYYYEVLVENATIQNSK